MIIYYFIISGSNKKEKFNKHNFIICIPAKLINFCSYIIYFSSLCLFVLCVFVQCEKQFPFLLFIVSKFLEIILPILYLKTKLPSFL